MRKPSPTPWVYEGREYPHGEKPPSLHIITDNEGNRIVWVRRARDRAMVKASPIMLEALRAIRDDDDEWAKCARVGRLPHGIRQKLDAAIAEAEGRPKR